MRTRFFVVMRHCFGAPPRCFQLQSFSSGGAEIHSGRRHRLRIAREEKPWTVGIVGGLLSGTYMRFADEMAIALNDGDNLRILPIVSYGAASNLDDLLHLRASMRRSRNPTCSNISGPQRKTPNLDRRVNYVIRSADLGTAHPGAQRRAKPRRPARQEGQFRSGRHRRQPDRDPSCFSGSASMSSQVTDRSADARCRSCNPAKSTPLPAW